jgi:hypothetical protein
MRAIIILLCILLLSCGNAIDTVSESKQPDAREVSTSRIERATALIKDSVVQDEWNGAHCHYYFPNSASLKDTIAILLIFDPAAKGEAQIKAWKKIANERSILLLSLDDSRNGMKATDVANFVKSIKLTMPVYMSKPYKMYGIGLSGGSRVVSALQSNEQLFQGIILCCAAPKSSNLGCPTILFSATEDMNFLECYEYFQANSSKNLQMRIEQGKHEWPINDVLSELLKNILVQPFKSGLVNTPKMSLSAAVMNYEADQQVLVNEAYFKQPIDYWRALLAKRRASKETVEKRILNYTSLFTYSVVNSPEVVNDLSAYDYALTIYQWSDPDNSEWMYLRSIYYLQQKDENNALKYLEKAIKNGFSNTERLFQNTYWKNYVNDQRFISILAKQ